MKRGQKQALAEATGSYSGKGKRFAIVVARFNHDITSKLLVGAKEALADNGVLDADVKVAWTPGAFEIPLAAKRLAETGLYAGVVCLGAVVRGETAHFEYVAANATGGIATAALETNVPMTLGILTTENMQQAIERAGPNHENKGYESALAALEMANLLQEVGGR